MSWSIGQFVKRGEKTHTDFNYDYCNDFCVYWYNNNNIKTDLDLTNQFTKKQMYFQGIDGFRNGHRRCLPVPSGHASISVGVHVHGAATRHQPVHNTLPAGSSQCMQILQGGCLGSGHSQTCRSCAFNWFGRRACLLRVLLREASALVTGQRIQLCWRRRWRWMPHWEEPHQCPQLMQSSIP